MSSYKGHSIFAVILSIMFFQNPLLIALTLIGANIPDFDHEFKKDNVYGIIISGLITFIILYILKLPYYIGLIIVFLGITFYFSNHRSFTHSIFGIMTIAASITLMLVWSLELILNISSLNSKYMIMTVLIVLLSFMFLNKKILMIYLPLLLISIFILPNGNFTIAEIFSGLLLGLTSHAILDSFTPSGVKIFAPISSKKVYKKFGTLMIIGIIIILFIKYMPMIINILKITTLQKYITL